MADHRLPGRRRGRWAAVAASALAVTGLVSVAVGVARQEPAPPAPAVSAPVASPSAAASPSPAGGADASSARAAETLASPDGPAELGYSRPVRVEIPTIGVRSSLVDLGLDADGVMETPVPVDRAGWFTPSPPPGVPGATVLAGHVTWDREPSVFFRLGELRRGDRVRVVRADGVVTVFRVTRIGSFPKDSFPSAAVYTQPARSELRLITCGGEYDDAANRYLDNVIVWAEIVDVIGA